MTSPCTEGQDPDVTEPQHQVTESAGPPQPSEIKAEIKSENVNQQQNIGAQTNNYNYHQPAQDPAAAEAPVEELLEALPSLPTQHHTFRDPRHEHLRSLLEDRRLLLLTSYQERAAFAAAHSLAHDVLFDNQRKMALYPARNRDKDRSDLDLVALAAEEFLSKGPRIIVVEIQRWCTFLDSALSLTWGDSAKICSRLERYSSYLVLAVNEDLLKDHVAAARVRDSLPLYSVSHLRYLLSRDLAERAEEFEKRLLDGLAKSGTLEPREFYQTVEDKVRKGLDALERYLLDLEGAGSLPLAERIERLQPVRPLDVLRDDTEIHRAAVFAATYLPELSQSDFDAIVLALLGNRVFTEQRSRQAVGKDGEIVSIIEEVTESWADRWRREADKVFQDCHLRTVRSNEGVWVVDFTEPYLRRELRGHLERHFPWYVRVQCQVLQRSGALFSVEFSLGAVEGLVRLFVQRSLVDPAGFGSLWLLDLVRSLRIQLPDTPSEEEPEMVLVWLLSKAAEEHLKGHFYSRLALLIREILDHETLRPMVHEFFDHLIASGQHDALLDLVLNLARRLRFVPYFDPLFWIRRVLDQGNRKVRMKATGRLVAFARQSGPRIYDIFDAIHKWLPEQGRSRFSVSNFFALEFPFTYCLTVARSLPPQNLGTWPSRHPLFNALPEDPVDMRARIAVLVDWILDPRGAELEEGDPEDPTRTARFVRLEQVAALVEHWAWVLEGAADSGPKEGKDVLRLVLEEVSRRLGETERMWFQRIWQRRQDDYLQQAARKDEGAHPGRRQLVAHRDKLTQLRTQLAVLASQPVQ